MKWNGLALLIGLTVSVVAANAQQLDDGFQSVQAQVVGTLDPLLDNTSSLFYWEGDLWTCNDHGEVVFHALDTTTGDILRSIATGVMPSDMEEVAQDDAYFYLGDFGNNHELLRTDLRVLRFLKSDLLAGRIRPDTIAFEYEGYDPSMVKDKGLPTTDFDCEAMVAGTDSLYLFSKQWGSYQTVCYSLPKQPGTYTAYGRDTLDVQGMVTGACLMPGARMLALCGYNVICQPFVWLLYGYEDNRFLGGGQLRIDLDNGIGLQVESIATADGRHFFLTNEHFSRMGFDRPAQLLSLDLTDIITQLAVSDTGGVGLPVLEEPEQWGLQPNPTTGVVEIDREGVELVEVMDAAGRLMMSSQRGRQVDISGLPGGAYVVCVTFADGSRRCGKVVKQ
ncbi:MAG: T9SS type A sorting domain-containing protein [Bacteroidales bacterium]|nr:T9SS type A sorting domain-containing protein [Bacteroidales bacterium]